MSKLSKRIKELQDRIDLYSGFSKNVTHFLQKMGVEGSVPDQVAGFYVNAKSGFHGTKEIHKKYAKDTIRYYLLFRPSHKRAGGRFCTWEEFQNLLVLTTCFWNKKIETGGQLKIKTKHGVARNSSRNKVRPKYHYGEYMECPNCYHLVKLVFRQSKLFKLAPENRCFTCTNCGTSFEPEDIRITMDERRW